MGWWGHGPMGGDEPLDVEARIEDILSGRKERSGKDLLKALGIETQAQLDQVLDAKEEDGTPVFDRKDPISWHVLAVMAMRGGGPLHEIRENVLSAIDTDEWAKTDDERQMAMQKFREQVRQYVASQDLDVSSGTGLLETLQEVQSPKPRGLKH